MNTPRRPALVLAGLALGTLLALLIAPQTRWLVRIQWTASLGLYHPFLWCVPNVNSYSLSVRGDRSRENAVAARYPDNFPIQLAHASIGSTSSTDTLAHIRALKAQFPDNPSLDANALRYASEGSVRLNRDEDYLLAGKPIPKQPPAWAHLPTTEQLTLFDKDAADGERLEPDNAFFPFMRAVGLFAAHRDVEALAAIRRAGAKTRWDEHLTEEPNGQWRLHTEAFGDPNALWHAQAMGSVLLPEYASLRAVARVATYQAILAEQQGRTADGLAIRRSLMRCGGLMRTYSCFVVGSLVGIAIIQVAMYRPGGIPPPNSTVSSRLTSEEVFQNHTAAYTAYLHKIGQNDEAYWIQSEMQAAHQTRTIIGNIDMGTMTKSPLNRPALMLATLWIVALLVFSNVLWLLVFGGMATLFPRKNALAHSSLPLSAATAFLWGSLALLTELATLVALVTSTWIVTATFFLSYGLLLLLLAVLVVTLVFLTRLAYIDPARRDVITRRLRSALISFSLFALGTSILLSIAHWQTQSAISVIRLEQSFLALFQDVTTQTLKEDWATPVCMAMSLAVPLLIVFVSLSISLVRRIPFRTMLQASFRSAALPATAILLLIYGGLTLATLRQERAVNETVTRTLSGEGRYWAELSGRTWPGVTL